MSKDDENGPTGFAGLGDLVSNIDIPAAKPPPPSPAPPFSPLRSPPPPKVSTPDPRPRPAHRPFQVNETVLNPRKSGQSYGPLIWIVGIAVVWFLIWLSNSNKESNRRVAPPSYQAPSGNGNAAPMTDSTYQMAPQPAVLAEEQPPYGNGLSFSRNQIRYCLSEKIRIEGWRTSVNDNSPSSVEAFNAGVADYNQRCANFRYRRGSLESVRGEVETNRYVLLQAGRNVANRNP